MIVPWLAVHGARTAGVVMLASGAGASAVASLQLTGIAASVFPRPVPTVLLVTVPLAFAVAAGISNETDRTLEGRRHPRLMVARFVWFVALVAVAAGVTALVAAAGHSPVPAALANLAWFTTLTSAAAVVGLVRLAWLVPLLHAVGAMLFASTDGLEYAWWAWILRTDCGAGRLLCCAAGCLAAGVWYARRGAHND
ncbi:hypothetical protein [Isoptericola sp. NPDC057191]|uniref:hypothetical protein n=1 Tax=Isoptericola sp. NPDC057191 TaxID=3346041 RepID=UPI0036390907